jgi:hypothetical protein
MDGLETNLDKLVENVQELDERMDRAAILQLGTSASGLVLPEPSADGFLKWNTAANQLENSDAFTDQDLFTTDDVSFNSVTISGLTASLFVVTDGAKKLASVTDQVALDAITATTTKGDILVEDGTNVVRFPVGSNGEVLQADSAEATGLKWTTSASTTLTTKGDIFTYDTANARLGIGTNDQYLVADSAEVTGLRWATFSVDLAADVGATILPQANGGTGIDTSAATDGQLLIGGTASNDLQLAAITGTADQVTVTNGTNTITLATPQSINTTSSPSFTGLTVSGLTASRPVKTNGTSVLTSGLIDISDTTNDVTGTLAIGNGGTGQVTATASFDALSPTTTKGDILVDDGTNVIREAIGTNAHVLTADSTQASGLKWAEAPGGNGFISPEAAITGNYSADSDDNGRVVLVDSSAGAITVTLPTPAAAFIIGVKDVGGSALENKITIARNGSENIDGEAFSDFINNPYYCNMYISDGTDWWRWADFTQPGIGGIALFQGGQSGSYSNVVDEVAIPILGNATDFGDLTVARETTGGTGSATRSVVQGGYTGSNSNVIDYGTFTTAGNYTDFGDTSVTRRNGAGTASSTRGLYSGGNDGADSNVIDYITIASTGNSTDFGDLTAGRQAVGGCASSTRSLTAAGTPSNIIDYVTIASTGNATDFGDLTSGGRQAATGFSSSTRGIFAGANDGASPSDILDYVTIASAGNATDFGNLSVSRGACGANSNATRGIVGGGDTGAGSYQNVIDYVTIAATGNATDFGDLSVSRDLLTDACNSHGGLQ